MQLFHLGNSRYARQLTGDGARLFGGRWNQKGDACIYTSSARSLCLVEYLANVEWTNLPPDLVITVYELPNKLCRVIDVNELPDDWAAIPAGMATKLFGSTLLADPKCVCFAVPSVIVPAERNYILNPNSDNFKEVDIIAVEPFTIDQRIKI
ncbi:MAG: RES domain-containing protein [Chitinophagaceae bacterium]|nr:MAG: RES domain-containing protein [Chitinophagaceae bacterium]